MGELKNYYFNRLSFSDRACYLEVLAQLKNFSPLIKVDYVENFSKIMTNIANDRSELFYIDWGKLKGYSSHAGKIMFKPIYLFNKVESASYTKKIDKFISKLDCGGDDYSKAKCVHDFLLNKVKYDNMARDLHRPDSHSIIGPILFDEGVCEGIAEAAQYIFDYLNMDSTVILSIGKDRIGHKWNMVKIDGQSYHMDLIGDIDSKWDDNHISYNFFLISDTEMKRFYSWTEGPSSSTDGKDYFVREGLAVSSDRDLVNLLKLFIPGQLLCFKTIGGYSKKSADYIFKFCQDNLISIKYPYSLECKVNSLLGIYYIKLMQ